MNSTEKEPAWDAFISYASEDRAAVAQPLAEALSSIGLKIWFDRTALHVGDSLREQIDTGLAESHYGIVVLSPAFFNKHYPVRELNGLAQREVSGERVILPVWYGLTAKEVARFSPPLADRIAAQWIDGIDVVVDMLVGVIGRDLLSRVQAQAERIRELPVVAGGTELITVLAGVSAHAFVHDEFADSNDADAVGEFLQTLEDWIDALDEVGAADQARLSFDLTNSLKELAAMGWIVFAASVDEPIGHGISGNWLVACVAVVRDDRRRVARFDQKFIVVKGKDEDSPP